MWDWNDKETVVTWVTVILTIIAIFLFSFSGFQSNELKLKLSRYMRAHSWKSIQYSLQTCRCSICDSLILVSTDGYFCDCCGICADLPCLKDASKLFKCKEVSVKTKGPMKHKWSQGIVAEGAFCEVCEEECLHTSEDKFCMWCHRSIHASCVKSLAEVCDFGKLKSFIIPPNVVKLISKWDKQPQTISHPEWSSWTPLLVVANRKSGNQLGATVLSSWRLLLNPIQVIDLSEKSPSALGVILSALPDTAKPIILVAGGDGTIAWILSTLHHLQIKPEPSVAVIPLGTGNDLSRTMGWGAQEPSPFSPLSLMDDIRNAESLEIDRWGVNMKGGLLGRAKLKCMYNYLSIGVDALVTLDFHKTRQSPFYIFSHRFINKLLYLTFGTQQVMAQECKGLEKRLELYMDGHRVELPQIESIVILNIPYWGAGVKLWAAGDDGTEEIPEQKLNDGKVEVVAIYSSFHIAQLQVGLSEPLRLGQASSVTIKLKAKSPMQIDGEPWMQPASDITITLLDKANLLKAVS